MAAALALAVLLTALPAPGRAQAPAAAPVTATEEAPAHGRPAGRRHDWSVDQALQMVRQDPAKAAARLERMLTKVRQREQSSREQYAAESRKAAAYKEPAEQDLAKAALAVHQAELARLQARAVLLEKLLAYARSQPRPGA